MLSAKRVQKDLREVIINKLKIVQPCIMHGCFSYIPYVNFCGSSKRGISGGIKVNRKKAPATMMNKIMAMISHICEFLLLFRMIP